MKISWIQLILGAVMGLILSFLFTMVKDTLIKSMKIKGTLQNCELQLEILKAQVKNIESNVNAQVEGSELNVNLHELVSRVNPEIRKGEILIRRCSVVSRHQVCERAWYKGKLDKLDKTLLSWYRILLLHEVRNIRTSGNIRIDKSRRNEGRGMSEKGSTSTAEVSEY